MRLVQYLAKSGVAARRKSETMVKDGQVKVNGRKSIDPGRELKPTDQVSVEGRVVRPQSEEYYLLHKPLGVISTAKDTHGRRTVVEMIQSKKRLYPVGRLDADTTGLIIVTNDGSLANRLTHPKFEVPKTYRVTVWGTAPKSVIDRLKKGVLLEDGKTARARVREVSRGGNRSTLDITIHEGRNRQVRRMCAAVGSPVMELVRIQFGPLKLGDVPLGQYRRLTPLEIGKLQALATTD